MQKTIGLIVIVLVVLCASIAYCYNNDNQGMVTPYNKPSARVLSGPSTSPMANEHDEVVYDSQRGQNVLVRYSN